MFPILPILCALGGIGLQVLRERGRAWLWLPAICLSAAAAVYSAATLKQLTFEKLGVQVSGNGPHSAFDSGGSENRLLFRAHAAADLCGLKITSRDLPYAGGFTYLHRRVPLYGPPGPPESSRRFNYVIGASGAVAGTIVAADGGLVLARIFNGRCESDPSYTWQLE